MEKSDPTLKMPAKSPPTEPFIPPKPADPPVDRLVDRPVMATGQALVEAQHDRPTTVSSHRPTDQPSNNQTPFALSQFPGLSGLHSTQDTGTDLDSDSDTDPVN